MGVNCKYELLYQDLEDYREFDRVSKRTAIAGFIREQSVTTYIARAEEGGIGGSYWPRPGCATPSSWTTSGKSGILGHAAPKVPIPPRGRVQSYQERNRTCSS